MGQIIAKLYRNSNDLTEKMNSIQFNDTPLTMETNIFEKVIEEEQPYEYLDDQYSVPLSINGQDSLDQALMNSLYDTTNPRPLALYIRDEESIATQIFNEVVLWSDGINSYLNTQFALWTWNLTKENYYELLTIITTHAGDEVASVIDSFSIDVYPLLICLIFDRGQIKVESVIQGTMSDNEAFSLLIQAHDAFNARFDLPDTTGLTLKNISTENWSITASTLINVSNQSDEFQRVANDFDGGASSIIRIDRIENTIWLLQYLNQKQIVESRIGYDESEKLLFHGCPYVAAEQILQQGFDHDRIGRNGSLYGRGFYFSARRSTSDRYALPDPLTGEKRILMCRVLVGRSCKGNATMNICPVNYDSTTNHADIHVIYSNRHVLPEYLITYK